MSKIKELAIERNWPQAEEFLNWLTDKAVAGVPGVLPGDVRLSSASELAQEYLRENSYADHEKRVDALIRWESTKTFVTGFICGLGGILTIPIALPGALVASWIIQARMAAAIACIYGHHLNEDRVRTVVVLSLVGKPAIDVLRDAGVTIGKKLTTQLVKKIPGRLLIEINKRVGFRLLTKAGEKGVVNIIKVVPIVGGGISGAFDAATCKATGEVARRLFSGKSGAVSAL